MAKSGVLQVHLQARSASNQQEALWFILGKSTSSSIQVDIFIFIPSVLLKYIVNGICIVNPLIFLLSILSWEYRDFLILKNQLISNDISIYQLDYELFIFKAILLNLL